MPDASVSAAADALHASEDFEPCPLESFNNYTEHKRGFPRLGTTPWCSPAQYLVVLPASRFGLDPIAEILVGPQSRGRVFVSPRIRNMMEDPQHVADLPFPRLARLIKGLARRFLDSEDDMAMVNTEQLVDGMNLDHAWLDKNIDETDPEARNLIKGLINGKKSRLDDLNGNLVTCYVKDDDEAAALTKIPGYH